MVRGRELCLGVVLAILSLPSPAAAQDEEGVIVDPRSPAGKEYAIPLDRARREAQSGGTHSASPARTPGVGGASLFGVGISAG